MAEEQEYTLITSSVARDDQLNISSHIVDPSMDADKLPSLISVNQSNKLSGTISADQNIQIASPIIIDQNKHVPSPRALPSPSYADLNNEDDDLAESTNGDPNISITSETSGLNYSLSNDLAPIDKAAASQVLSGEIESTPEQRGSKRKLSSASATGSSSDSVSGSGSGLYVAEPVPKAFKPSPDPERLKEIKALADQYIQGCSYTVVREFYRNKHHSYFNEIKQSGGIMKKHIKDNSGDPHCPINGELEGLFFMCSPDDSSPPKSPFGSKRLILPSDRFLNVDTNLYFSDFFCLRSRQTHYISLVITTCSSEADIFCKQNLLLLDKYDNPYLELGKEKKGANNLVYVVQKSQLWVEIFYTENVDIGDVPLQVGEEESGPRYVRCESTNPSGKFATISSSGIQKGKNCSYCNPQ